MSQLICCQSTQSMHKMFGVLDKGMTVTLRILRKYLEYLELRLFVGVNNGPKKR